MPTFAQICLVFFFLVHYYCEEVVQPNTTETFLNTTTFVEVETNLTAVPANSTQRKHSEIVQELANNMFEEFWEIKMRDNPETATSFGDHRYNNKLSSYSLKSCEKRKVVANEFLERANQILSLAEEGSETHNNLQLFIMKLMSDLDQIMIGSHLFPVTMLWTPQMSLRMTMKYMPLNTMQDYWNLISRYRAMPQQIDEQIELMREGMRTNFTLNERSMIKTEEPQILSAQESFFYEPFLNLSTLGSEEEINAIQENASEAVMNVLLPSFQKLLDFMNNEYSLKLRPEIGIGSLSNGKEIYSHELSYHLSDDNVTAEEIHAMGLSEVQRITTEMENVIASLGLNLTRDKFNEQLRNNNSQFFSSEDEALIVYREIIAKVITPKLPLLFKKIPSKKLTVEKVPNEIATGPRAYYMSASPDGSTSATFYLDTQSLNNIPKYEVITLALHEGVPGHHFEISYSMEQENIPKFRKYGLLANAYTEGWALYAEYLGYEMGLYQDPFMLYGHLSEEIFRACRMVVDTGMHVLGWSREEAIEYMVKNSAATRGNIEREIDRYISWPGQACSYKYGEMKIKELRKKAEDNLGESFDIKEFHDVVLRSKGPLEFVEQQVMHYIAQHIE